MDRNTVYRKFKKTTVMNDMLKINVCSKFWNVCQDIADYGHGIVVIIAYASISILPYKTIRGLLQRRWKDSTLNQNLRNELSDEYVEDLSTKQKRKKWNLVLGIPRTVQEIQEGDRHDWYNK